MPVEFVRRPAFLRACVHVSELHLFVFRGVLIPPHRAADLLSPSIPRYTTVTRTISAKLPEDLIEEIEEYQEEDESRSAAVRRLIRNGLEPPSQLTPIAMFQQLGWIFISGAFFDVTPAGGYFGIAIIVLTVLEIKFNISDKF